MTPRPTLLLMLLAASSVALGSCAVAPAGSGSAGTASGATPGRARPLPPPGLGTLRQDDITVSLRQDALQIKVTPLLERVILATAPDTYRRLHGLAEAHGDPTLGDERAYFLVSFFTEDPGTAYMPEDLNLVSRGLRLRPDRIAPVTPDWGQYRLEQRRTEMAVYAFEGSVDLESELVVLYQGVESSEWTVIRPRVEAELVRVRARPGRIQASSSYLEIFR